MKLMLLLSHNGILSRRKAFEAIKAGAVSVNGRVNLEPSWDVDPARDKVDFNGRPVNDKVFEYIILNKPASYVTTCEKQFDQRGVLDLLPKELKHLRPVGRLDKDTEGLLLFTNDGELANQMMHPRFDVDKTYLVRMRWKLTGDDVRRLEEGVVIDGKKTSPAVVEVMTINEKESEIAITIHEGRKHQVRLMADAVGHPVVYLKRLRQGLLELGALRSGEWRRLTEEEVAQLRGVKLAVRGVVKNIRKRESMPKAEEKKYIGRRGRGEYNRDQRELRNSREKSASVNAGERGGFLGDRRVRSSGGRPSGDRSRPVVSRDERPRAPRPEYSSSKGHRSSPRSGETPSAVIKPLFSSHSEKRRFSSTREWHSETDVHAKKDDGRRREERKPYNKTSRPPR